MLIDEVPHQGLIREMQVLATEQTPPVSEPMESNPPEIQNISVKTSIANVTESTAEARRTPPAIPTARYEPRQQETVSARQPIPLIRRRAKHGPEGREAPLTESPINRAIRTASTRPSEPIFRPYIGLEFNSMPEAKEFINLYSWEVGFGIRRGRSHTNDNGYTTRLEYVCSCEGSCSNVKAESIRTGCPAYVRLHRTSDHGWWISSVDLYHNHPCSRTYGQNKQWPSHNDIDHTTKQFIKKLRENNVPLGRVCSILGVHGNNPALPICKQSVRTVCAKLAQENIKDDLVKTMEVLDDMKAKDPGMEVRFKLDGDGRIKSMLWCTGRNRTDYTMFGDVITFDTTYRTNLYNLPFGLFIGVNNHFQSVVFGGVLLTSEKTEDFEWSFATFADVMGGKTPQTILTDQCAAMAAALKTTWTNTKHRWCKWHVLRKTKQKVGPTYSKKSLFKKEFNSLVTEETSSQRFERRWRQLTRKYNLETNRFLERLYKHRKMWAKPYFMTIFCAGMTSTQRSESANHMLKQFIPRAAPMHMFVQKFNEFQSDRKDQEEKEEHLTKQKSRKRRLGVPIEKHAEKIYTRRIYEKFNNELYYSGGFVIKNKQKMGVYEVVHSTHADDNDAATYQVVFADRERIDCSCGLYTHMGILCRHCLKVLVNQDTLEIPIGNIHPRWTGTLTEGSDQENTSFTNVVPGANGSFLKRKILLKSILEVTNQTGEINDEAFTGAMDAINALRQGCSNSESSGDQCNHKLVYADNSPLLCPQRPQRSCRPPGTSLRSWMEQKKRTQQSSTDEENPNGGKTRRLSDLDCE